MKFVVPRHGILQELRTTFDVDYPLQSVKVGKQFQTAEERGCDVAVVVDQQINDRQVEVKVLATREQKKVSLNEAGLALLLQTLQFNKQNSSAGLPDFDPPA